MKSFQLKKKVKVNSRKKFEMRRRYEPKRD